MAYLKPLVHRAGSPKPRSKGTGVALCLAVAVVRGLIKCLVIDPAPGQVVGSLDGQTAIKAKPPALDAY